MKLRKASMQDVEKIHSLINYWANKGLMLPRSRSLLYECLREFTVVYEGDRLVGTGSLHIVWENLAEVRAVAVAPEYQGRRVGSMIVRALLEESRELGIKRVFALTYQPEFFKKLGFRVISKQELPHKVWQECINCPKFPDCDETAMAIDNEDTD